MNDTLDHEWTSLYSALRDALSRFGVEDPYGDGNYWIVDDNWGDLSHKVEFSRAASLTPALVASVQEVLQGYPAWQVLLQINESVGTSPASTSGYTVRHDAIEAVGLPSI